VNKKGKIGTAVAAVVLLWGGFAYDVSRPADGKAYRRTILQVAEAAHDAAQTGRLTGEQQLADQVTTPFARTAFGDAAKALAGAEQKFAAEGPPDSASAELRDQLAPLLSTAVQVLGDTAEAGDDDTLRDGVHRLDSLAERLEEFITAHG
jgi:hypothetical protein